MKIKTLSIKLIILIVVFPSISNAQITHEEIINLYKKNKSELKQFIIDNKLQMFSVDFNYKWVESNAANYNSYVDTCFKKLSASVATGISNGIKLGFQFARIYNPCKIVSAPQDIGLNKKSAPQDINKK